MDVPVYGQDRVQRMLRERVQGHWMEQYAPVRHIDIPLVVSALALAGIGVIMIYSATFTRLDLQGQPTGHFATRQLIGIGIGVAAMLFTAAVDYRYTRAYSVVIYAVAILGLVVVLTPLGSMVGGAQRWIVLGGFQIQPSEFSKAAIIIVLAALLSEARGHPGFGTVSASALLVAVPMVLIFLEPDLGTSIVFVWVAFVLLLVGGARLWHLVTLGLAGIAAIAAAVQYEFIEQYQLTRLTAFLDAGNVDLARTSAFHTNQSLIAIGSGQLAGKGLFEGTQTNLAYVPENHTDFIFTVVGEEFGFVGAMVVLGLFGIILWRALRIALGAKDMYGTLLAAGVVALLALQIFVNVGMTIGIMPVTGIPLPFLSYGINALIVNFALIGLLVSVHMRRF